MTIVFDIDGTLSLPGDRLKHLAEDPPNWNKFYERCGEDDANRSIQQLCWLLQRPELPAYTYYLTGRRESCREATENWLRLWGLSARAPLLMRPDGDTRHDTIVKPELLTKAGINPDIIFEDRNSMVAKWRELGFTCCQVAEGDF